MSEQLSGTELTNLILSVFPKQPGDRKLAILVDIPRNSRKDNFEWKQRRDMAETWFKELKNKTTALGLQTVSLIAYEDVESNNADFPKLAYLIFNKLPSLSFYLEEEDIGEEFLFSQIFKDYQLFLAPTEFSPTAPLKNAAKKFNIRAATMPGFTPQMIPALRIDYNEVYRRVSIIKKKLDPAQWAKVLFTVDNNNEYQMFFDLRFRTAHLSSGRFPEKGTAGNLPSGETYIVPYEGEKEEKSKTEGILPIQIGNDLLYYTIKENKAISVNGEGELLAKEQARLSKEPAYGNMAELGFGVLADFGLSPINEVLLDEKLGFHIAFGRSDHFGGAIGPKDFSSPSEVTHLDHIYIPATQPRISVKKIILGFEKDKNEIIMEGGIYTLFKDSPLNGST